MSLEISAPHATCERLDRTHIDARLSGCACLPSLSSIDSALRELLGADQRYTSQIAEIIRRDPSLTARLLRLVNSVYYGMAKPVKKHRGSRLLPRRAPNPPTGHGHTDHRGFSNAWPKDAAFRGGNSGATASPSP
jgi:hypothetical protein